jgi:hypothetical protein
VDLNPLIYSCSIPFIYVSSDLDLNGHMPLSVFRCDLFMGGFSPLALCSVFYVG